MTKFRKNNLRSAKLNGEQVMEIRAKFAKRVTQGQLAREYGMSVVQIGRIVRCESWAELPEIVTDQEFHMQVAKAEYGVSKSEVQRSAERVMELLKADGIEIQREVVTVTDPNVPPPIDYTDMDVAPTQDVDDSPGLMKLYDTLTKERSKQELSSVQNVDAKGLLDELEGGK